MSEYELQLQEKTERYIVERIHKSGDTTKYAVSITRYESGVLAEVVIDDTVIYPAYLRIIKFLDDQGLLK